MRKIVLLLFPLIAFAQMDFNLSNYKRQLQAYVSSGAYEFDQWRAIKPAMHYLAHHNFSENSAIVFDIDETLLSNYQSMQAVGFGGNSEIFHENEMLANAELIPASFALYKAALAKGLKVFIITGRGIMVQAATIKNLKLRGIDQYESIEFWHGKKPATVLSYKSNARCAIERAKYHIVLNVGDQASDLVGPCRGDVAVKLPNPFYAIPADQLKRSFAY